MSTWKYEALFVGLLLVVVSIVSGGKATDWLGSAAVLLTFMHGQISFDFQESQMEMSEPEVSCYRWSGRYFVGKEVLWTATFIMLEAWPLLAGTIIFATYPRWRKWLRNFVFERRSQKESE